MDKEQRRRAATRELVTQDEYDCETQLIIRVSGDEVEFTRGQQHPWDNEHGTGNDETWETWAMDLDTLKRFIQAANWCIEKSEAFEKWERTKQNAEAFNAASMRSLDRFIEKDEQGFYKVPEDPGDTEDDHAQYREEHGYPGYFIL